MSLMKLRRNRKGFTLIEMMIVIAVIAILAAVLIPKSGLVQKSAKEQGVEANARVVQALVEREKVRAADADALRSVIVQKLGDSVKNPFTNAKGAVKATAVDTVYAVTVGSSATAVTTTPGTAVGAVVVDVADTMKVTISPYDSKGAKITEAVIEVDY